MRGMQGTHRKKAKETISIKLKQIWHERLNLKRQQNRLYGNWAQLIAISAKRGGYGERELDWDSYKKIRADLISEEMKEKTEKRIKRRVREEILARIKVKEATKRGEKRREETAGVKKKTPSKHGSIKETVKLKKRLTKLHYRKKKLDESCSSKEIAPDPRRTGDDWNIELIKERLEIGVSLLDQLQLVKDRRKEAVPSD